MPAAHDNFDRADSADFDCGTPSGGLGPWYLFQSDPYSVMRIADNRLVIDFTASPPDARAFAFFQSGEQNGSITLIGSDVAGDWGICFRISSGLDFYGGYAYYAYPFGDDHIVKLVRLAGETLAEVETVWSSSSVPFVAPMKVSFQDRLVKLYMGGSLIHTLTLDDTYEADEGYAHGFYAHNKVASISTLDEFDFALADLNYYGKVLRGVSKSSRSLVQVGRGAFLAEPPRNIVSVHRSVSHTTRDFLTIRRGRAMGPVTFRKEPRGIARVRRQFLVQKLGTFTFMDSFYKLGSGAAEAYGQHLFHADKRGMFGNKVRTYTKAGRGVASSAAPAMHLFHTGIPVGLGLGVRLEVY